MTTVAYASDLHLEFGNTVNMERLEAADILVLAGDIDSMPEGWADLLRRLRKVFAGPIVGVLGNHAYYNGVFPDDREKFREAIIHDRHAYLLEKDRVILEGIRFLGATLWTDFADGKQMRSCQRMMSDFEVIFDGHSGSITPEVILKVHQDTLDWLDTQIMGHAHKGPTVVITHHAPSYQSQHPRFAGSPISGGFCSNQEHRLQSWSAAGLAPELWIHGHVHDPMDYRIGQTRILCNPWGYPDEGNDMGFRLVEI
ncbi:metallophosphoesterase [Acidithiobacillus sp. HP-6]|uniref:metallophosphoesterase n=1 Tax=unclassified Acidithiobacillus TaxID=2614800 RepID=UPI00187AC18D|nr:MULTISPECIES: metallophosphoesterase [unclassified Acidithiobacillus]MBE7562159.1 metallophosphoesterase [Acidithiobacillus sp. HP-6]MBE7570555.1 metallophosphoesterase [Acidithiobacillus sp. HP-2]